jgi:hypothetical protein
VGQFIVDDPEVEQSEVEAIFQNPKYTIPQDASRKKQQLLQALIRFTTLHKQFIKQGANDKSRVTPKGIQIQFDLGQAADAFKSAVEKIAGIKHDDTATDANVADLSIKEIIQALFDGKLKLDNLTDKQKKQVFQSIPLIKKDAELMVQAKAFAVAAMVYRKASNQEIAKVLMQDGVADGVNLEAFDQEKLKGIAKAMNLDVADISGSSVIGLMQTALAKDNIEDVNDLRKMSYKQIAALLQAGRLEPEQMTNKQIETMLRYYRINPHVKPEMMLIQLKKIASMRASPSSVDAKQLSQDIQTGIFSAYDFERIGISDAMIQKIIIAAGRRLENNTDRKSLIQQLKNLEQKPQESQKNWKDISVREKASPVDIIKAVADGNISFSDLKQEEISRVFDPNDKAAMSAIDNLGIENLSDVMPEVIDGGYMDLNDASKTQLEAYLKGKNFKKRFSGNLDGLRRQAMSISGGIRHSESQRLDEETQGTIKKIADSLRAINYQGPIEERLSKIAVDLINQGADAKSETFNQDLLDKYQKDFGKR